MRQIGPARVADLDVNSSPMCATRTVKVSSLPEPEGLSGVRGKFGDYGDCSSTDGWPGSTSRSGLRADVH